MGRLSSPESIQKKIGSLHEKIDALYETVNLIRQLETRFRTLYEDAERDRKLIRDSLDSIRTLEEDFHETLEQEKTQIADNRHQVDGLIRELEAKTGDLEIILNHANERHTDLETAEEAVNEAINLLNTEKSAFTDYLVEYQLKTEEQIENRISGIGKDTENQMLQHRETLEKAIAQKILLAQNLKHEMGNHLQKEMEACFEQAKTAHNENILEIRNIHAAFAQEQEKRISEKLGQISAQTLERITGLETASSEEKEETRKRIEELFRKIEEIAKETREKTTGLETASSEEKEETRQRIDELFQTIYAVKRDGKKEQALEGRILKLEAFDEKLNEFTNNIHPLVEEAILKQMEKENKGVEELVDKRIQHAFPQQEMEKTKEQLSLQKKKAESFDQQVKTLFQDMKKDMEVRESKLVKQLKETLDKRDRLLEKKLKEEMVHHFSFEDFSGNLEEKIQKNHSETKNLHNMFNSLVDQVQSHLNSFTTEMMKRQKSYQNQMNQKLQEMTEKMGAAPEKPEEKDILAVVNTAMKSRDERMEKMLQQVNILVENFSSMQNYVEKTFEEQEQMDSKMANFIKKLAANIKENQSRYHHMEKRILKMESASPDKKS